MENFIIQMLQIQYEKETKKSAISKNNSLNYKYIDEKLLEDKK